MVNSALLGALLLSSLVPAVIGQSPVWGQCGGQGWTGSKSCASGSCCASLDNWYSQCIPGDNCGGGGGNPPAATTQQPPTPTNGGGNGGGAGSGGCGKSPGLTSGVKTIQVGGKTRQYTIRVPNNYNSNTKYKVIFGFHWRGGNMGAVSGGGYYDLVRLANEQVIFVAPNGFSAGWGNSGGEDVRFVDALVSLISSSLCVNPKLFFATGWSFGGGMSHSLACSRANIFRGVAVLSGAEISGCDGGNTPIAYLGIHGVGDSVLNVSNGRSLRDRWLRVNGCQAKNAPEPQAWTGSHIKTTYSCRAGYPVVWIAHSGDHISNPRDTNGPYWAPGETWDFFKQFS